MTPTSPHAILTSLVSGTAALNAHSKTIRFVINSDGLKTLIKMNNHVRKSTIKMKKDGILNHHLLSLKDNHECEMRLSLDQRNASIRCLL